MVSRKVDDFKPVVSQRGKEISQKAKSRFGDIVREKSSAIRLARVAIMYPGTYDYLSFRLADHITQNEALTTWVLKQRDLRLASQNADIRLVEGIKLEPPKRKFSDKARAILDSLPAHMLAELVHLDMDSIVEIIFGIESNTGRPLSVTERIITAGVTFRTGIPPIKARAFWKRLACGVQDLVYERTMVDKPTDVVLLDNNGQAKILPRSNVS